MPFLFLCSLFVQLFFSLNNQLATWYHFQELSANLGLYWLAAHSISVGMLLLGRGWGRVRFRHVWILLLLLMSWQYVSPLLALSTGERAPPPAEGDSKFRVLSANVFTSNRNFAGLRALIAEYDPDIVGLMEVDAAWIHALGLAKEYPFSTELPREDNFGIALYSRFPFVSEVNTEVGELLPPVIHGSVALPNGAQVELMYLHSLQPLLPESFHPNRVLIRRLSTPLRHSSNPVLVFGDLNATWYSGLYKRFREAGRLRDAMAGFGVYRTWHAENLLLRLTLDHMLYRGMSVQHYERGPAFGSDHYPIIADFSISPPEQNAGMR